MSESQRKKLIDLVMTIQKVTRDEATRAVEEAMKKIEAGLTIGVTGFWS